MPNQVTADDAQNFIAPPFSHKKALAFTGAFEVDDSLTSETGLFPLYCKQDIFIFYIQWLIFLLIGNTMKNTMLRKGLTIF